MKKFELFNRLLFKYPFTTNYSIFYFRITNQMHCYIYKLDKPRLKIIIYTDF